MVGRIPQEEAATILPIEDDVFVVRKHRLGVIVAIFAVEWTHRSHSHLLGVEFNEDGLSRDKLTPSDVDRCVSTDLLDKHVVAAF
jgi:hypothetical protein